MIRNLIERLGWDRSSARKSAESASKPLWKKNFAATPEGFEDMLEKTQTTEEHRILALKLVRTRDPKESLKLAKQLVPGIKISKKNGPAAFSRTERKILATATREEAQEIFEKYMQGSP